MGDGVDLERLVERALESEFFSAPQLEGDLRRFLTDSAGEVFDRVAEARRAGVETVYFVGSGGSWASTYTGKYLFDRLAQLPAEHLFPYELCWQAPHRLGPRALVILASYSGATEDTLAALRFAKGRGAHTIALVRQAESPLGSEADRTIAYESSGLYCLPLAALSLFALEWARLDGAAESERLLAELQEVPTHVGRAFRSKQNAGRQLAEEFSSAELLYCVGAGPLYGLAYKFALTVFMENLRVHASVVESSEFRHGPAEMLDRHRPDLVFLFGTDESRTLTQRALDFVVANGARAATFDAADYPGLDPLFTPFVLKVALQWFVVYSAFMRGIDDLDERAFMGHGVLAESGAKWP